MFQELLDQEILKFTRRIEELDREEEQQQEQERQQIEVVSIWRLSRLVLELSKSFQLTKCLECFTEHFSS